MRHLLLSLLGILLVSNLVAQTLIDETNIDWAADIPNQIYNYSDIIAVGSATFGDFKLNSPYPRTRTTDQGLNFYTWGGDDFSSHPEYPSWLLLRGEIRYEEDLINYGNTQVYELKFTINQLPFLTGACTIWQRFHKANDGPDIEVYLKGDNEWPSDNSLINAGVIVKAFGSDYVKTNILLKEKNHLLIAVYSHANGHYKVSLNGETLTEGSDNTTPDITLSVPAFGIYNHGETYDSLELTHTEHRHREYSGMADFSQFTTIDPNLTPSSPTITEHIHIDQFGYRTDAQKIAVLVNPQVGFNANESYTPGNNIEVREESTGNTVHTGNASQWSGGATNTISGDAGWQFDFSSLQTVGSYYVYDVDNNLRSDIFEIKDDIYNEIIKTAMRTFYYQRLGITHEAPYAESGWTDAAAYLGSGQDSEAHDVNAKTNEALIRDMRGGWMDAGDINKYVTFVEDAIHDLLEAYEQRPEVWGDNSNIPESGNGLPDIIDEIIWELDWLLSMQEDNGGVHNKIGVLDYNETSPLSNDNRPKYYGPICSSSTICLASMFSHAAVTLRSFPSLNSYADTLETRAIKAWDWYKNNPQQTDCDDGEIKSGDADIPANTQDQIAIAAAVFLFDLTGDTEYNQYIINNYTSSEQFTVWWGPYHTSTGNGLLHYASLSNADASTATAINNKKNEIKTWYEFYGNTSDLYQGSTESSLYSWGSNRVVTTCGTINYDYEYYGILNDATEYTKRAEEQLHYMHGVNPMGLVYLTNMYSLGAESSCNELYHTWFGDGTPFENALTSTYGPPPGYVPGGANSYFNISPVMDPPMNQPVLKSYKDWNTGYPENSWEFSENDLSYQSSYVKLLSKFAQPVSQAYLDTEIPSTPSNLTVSNTTHNSIGISWDASTDNSGINTYQIWLNGSLSSSTSQTTASITGLNPNTSYTIELIAIDNAGNPSNAASITANTTAISYPNIYDVSSEPQAQYTVENILDGDTGDESRWSAETYPQWVIIDYGSAEAITQTNLYTYNGRAYQYEIYGAIDVNDVINENPSSLLVDNTNNTNTSQPISNVFSETAIRYIKIKITGAAVYTGEWTSITEFSIENNTDNETPSIPQSLAASNITESTASLNWTASTDNVAVTSYEIFVNGIMAISSTNTNYTLTGLSDDTNYSIELKAIDAAGNKSALSSSVEFTTVEIIIADTEAPSIPAGLSQSNLTENTVTVSWTSSTDNTAVAGYEVYIDGSLYYVIGTNTINITGLIDNTTYLVRVLAFDGANNKSVQSTALSITTPELIITDTQAPSIPQNLISTETTETTASISWSASSDNTGVSGYELYLNGNLDNTSSNNNYTFTGLSDDTNYLIYIIAFDAAGNKSGASESISITTDAIIIPDTEAPSIPAGLTSSNIGETNLTVSWTASTDNTSVAGYTVLLDGITYSTTNLRSLTISGLVASTNYSITITAFDGAGNVSNISSPLSLRTADIITPTDTESPSIPNALSTTSITEISASISWVAATDNVGISGYEVYKDGVFVSTTNLTSYTITGLTAGTSYSITVLAFDEAQNKSAQSTSLTVITINTSDSEAPSIPNNLASITITETTATFNWDASSDNTAVSSYEIYLDGNINSFTNFTSKTITGLTPGTNYVINVTALDAAENRSALSAPLVIVTPSTTTGLENKIEVNIYPNPVSSTLTIESTETIKNISIYNTQGIFIQESLSMSHLPKGIYILKLAFENEVITKKIIKE